MEYQQKIMMLQRQLQEKENKLFKLSAIENKYQLFRNNIERVIQENFEEFFESSVANKMHDMEKVHKKLQYKLKNLKRASMLAKDRQEAKRSSRLI